MTVFDIFMEIDNRPKRFINVRLLKHSRYVKARLVTALLFSLSSLEKKWPF